MLIVLSFSDVINNSYAFANEVDDIKNGQHYQKV